MIKLKYSIIDGISFFRVWVSILGCVSMLVLVVACSPGRQNETNSANGHAGGEIGTRHKPSQAVPTNDASYPRLKVLALHCEKDETGFITVSGLVKNISEKRLKIWVVLEDETASGDYIDSNGTDTSYSPLMPQQSSPFLVHHQANPQIKKVKIGFTNYLLNSNGDKVKIASTGKLLSKCY